MTDATNTADTTEQDAQKRLRIRVAHCYRDDTGMLRSREGWLALSEPKPTEKNDSFLVSFPDTGKSELVPAKQLQILSMDCGGNLQVVHVVRCDNNAVVRKGARTKSTDGTRKLKSRTRWASSFTKTQSSVWTQPLNHSKRKSTSYKRE